MCRSQHVRFPRHRLLRARTRRPMPIVTAVVAVANKRSRRRRHRHRHRHHTHAARRRSAATRAATHAIYGRYFIAYIDARAHVASRRTARESVAKSRHAIAEATEDGSNRLRPRDDAATRDGTPNLVEYNVPLLLYILKRRDAEVSARRVMTCACIAKCNVWCERPRRATRCDAMRCVHATRAMTPRESRCAAGYKI